MDTIAKIKKLQEYTDSMKEILNSLSLLDNSIDKMPQNEPSQVIDLQTIRNLLIEKTRKGMGEEIRCILKEFGADKLSELEEDQYDKFYQRIHEWEDK